MAADFHINGYQQNLLITSRQDAGLLLAGGFVEYFFIESIPTDMPKI